MGDFQKREKQRKSQMNLELSYNQEEINFTENEFEVNPKEIHSHWLLGKLGIHIKDATEKKNKELEVFEILKSSTRTIENELLECLGIKLFNFIQFLIRNKEIIVWCTLLKRANEEEYEILVSKMN